MPSGSGPTLGAALVDLFAGGGRPGPRTSYDRHGWRAQFSQLSSTRAGYAAMERAGLSATTRTQRGWLTGDVEASKGNQGLIAQAYAAMAGGWNPSWESAQYAIEGRVTQGHDSRVRGHRNPFRIDGRAGQRSNGWGPIRRAWDDGADPARIEDLFVAYVVAADIGQGSYPWEFNGGQYTVAA